MSDFVQVHQPCPCGSSSDAYAIDKNGDGYCFSCAKYFDGKMDNDRNDNASFTYQVIDWRGIRKDIFDKYGVRFKINSEGEPVSVGFPYSKEGILVRDYAKKKFHSVGDMSKPSLFGMDTFPAGSSDTVIITEGALDALSAYQSTGLPCVSIRSSSSGFLDCSGNLDYLQSFQRIVLALDNDEPGKQAAKKIASLFDSDRVYQIQFDGRAKDANDLLQEGRIQDFRNMVTYARRFIPTEIVSSYSEIDKILNQEKEEAIVTYPFPTWQEMTYGIRPGIILITALEGQGKTEIIRAIEAHILRTTDLNIGVIHLEETERRSIQGLAGYELQKPVHLPDSFSPPLEIGQAYQRLTRRDERVHHINHFDDDDPRHGLDLIRFLVVKCNCRIVFLDHITMLVTGIEEQDERRRLDYLSTKLERMTQELKFSCIMISHVNDNGQTRGSRNISKVANVRIDLQRDHLNPIETERNKTFCTLSKNRDGAKTGPAGVLVFDHETFTVREWTQLDDIIPEGGRTPETTTRESTPERVSDFIAKDA